jgi:hypothetical protein
MDFPMQETGSTGGARAAGGAIAFDMRDHLVPRRLTMVMWNQAFLLRHLPGGSYEDYERVLDEAMERGYNTLRLDPLPQLVDLAKPEAVHRWGPSQGPRSCPGAGTRGERVPSGVDSSSSWRSSWRAASPTH